MTVTKLTIPKDVTHSTIGFSLDRTLSDATNPYLDSKHGVCLKEMEPNDETAVARFHFNFVEKM